MENYKHLTTSTSMMSFRRSTSTSTANSSKVRDDDYLPTTLPKQLVTAKELRIERYLEEIFDSLEMPSNNDVSTAELARIWKEDVRKKLAAMSVTLSHRTTPLVEIMLEQKLGLVLDKNFVHVSVPNQDVKEMVTKYQDCFETWVDDWERVHFRAMNSSLLGNMSAKDAFILTFFSQCTNRRVCNDNVLQLGLVGCSSSGKSTIFESVLMQGAHVTTNEKGVGRFQVGKKPVLLFHDIPIRTLTNSPDTEKIKTIARTEATTTKIHGTTLPLPPLFIFYSSNERLMNHEFPLPPTTEGEDVKPVVGRLTWRFYGHQVHSVGKKRISEDNLKAVQNRFIEGFVRQAPPLKPTSLPKYGGFQRLHGVLGMFPRILSILSKYEPTDFHSPVLYQYVLSGLASNVSSHRAITDIDLLPDLFSQIQRFVSSEDIRQSILKLI